MILTDREILRLVNMNVPLIERFKLDSLQSESYDLSIGGKYSKYLDDFKIVDLLDQKEINNTYKTEDIPENGLMIGPHDYVLLSIDERINMPKNITGHIRPRTRYTRMGLLISNQHCNSSYSGKLNLGLLNTNPFAVVIYSGMKIAQIVFEQLTEIPQKTYSGVYQNENGTKGADLTKEFYEKEKDTLQALHDNPEAMKLFKKIIDSWEE